MFYTFTPVTNRYAYNAYRSASWVLFISDSQTSLIFTQTTVRSVLYSKADCITARNDYNKDVS
jgi:hypothetical protein